MKERLLIIGGGGREHALGYHAKRSSQLEYSLYFAPGNPGTAALGVNIDIGVDEIEHQVRFAKDNRIDLVTIGPEDPLIMGAVDQFQAAQVRVFGPTQAAAQLEGSKIFSAEFNQRHGIPQPEFRTFESVSKAQQFIQNTSWKGVAIKPDGPARGKGVHVYDSPYEASRSIDDLMVVGRYGGAGKKIVIQKKVTGQEVSAICFTDGSRIAMFPLVQDHKRLLDNDEGPNTGGMGSYGPVPFVTPELQEIIQFEIMQKIVDGMKEEEREFRGALFANFMLTEEGPKVLEVNARLGDPETQTLAMLANSNWISAMHSCIAGTLKQKELLFREGSAISVVLATTDYPESPQPWIDRKINTYGKRLPIGPNFQAFHSGTKYRRGGLWAAGGRVLTVSAYGPTLKQASEMAYEHLEYIDFNGRHFRTDIGRSGLEYQSTPRK